VSLGPAGLGAQDAASPNLICVVRAHIAATTCRRQCNAGNSAVKCLYMPNFLRRGDLACKVLSLVGDVFWFCSAGRNLSR
jgi:hypothetical protein